MANGGKTKKRKKSATVRGGPRERGDEDAEYDAAAAEEEAVELDGQPPMDSDDPGALPRQRSRQTDPLKGKIREPLAYEQITNAMLWCVPLTDSNTTLM